MARHDPTLTIAPYLDRHLVFPLLEFLQGKQIYPEEQILKAKIELLAKTNMVDYMMDIHKTLYKVEDVPKEMVDRRAEVVNRLKALETLAAPLISFLHNPQLPGELKNERQANLQLLHDKYQIGADQIEALYQYAKFQFECGNYSGASDYLYQYRTLTTNSDRAYSAIWGKLAAEILMENWSSADYELNKLKDALESKSFSNPLVQVQNRVWLMHWSLFVFFNMENGRNGLIDLFTQERYQSAIQSDAPHLLRYLAAAVVVTKRKRPNSFKEFLKVIQQEHHEDKDPITQFLECLYINCDFEGAQRKLQECEDMIMQDFFMGKAEAPEHNYQGLVYKFRDDFMHNARVFMFETYCRIHQRIDIGMISEKLQMSYEDGERWIGQLIGYARQEARIDSVNGTIVMGVQQSNVYEQVIEKSKSLASRTYSLARNIIENSAVRT